MMGVLCPRKRLSGLSPSHLLLVQLMLTHDQQSTATDSSQNSYEQYIQNYAAQQVKAKGNEKILSKRIFIWRPVQAYAQQAYAVYVASFTRNRTYVSR